MRWEPVKELRWRARPGGRLRALCAASGLVRAPRGFWVVADDLHHLVFLPDARGHGRGVRLFEGKLPDDPEKRKRRKKDLEALIELPDGRLLAFPSGSKPRRRRAALWDGKRAATLELDAPLAALDRRIPQLNVEGGFVDGEDLVLLQRGNGRAGFNGVIRAALSAFLAGRLESLRVRRGALGDWDGATLGFTDGFLRDGTIYFCAAAEHGKDTYRDGEIAGTIVGTLGPRGPVVLSRLPGRKLEGLAPGPGGSLYAVTDADDPSRPSLLLRARLNPRA